MTDLTMGQIDAIAATQEATCLFRCKACGYINAVEPIWVETIGPPKCHRPMDPATQIGPFAISSSRFCGEYERVDG